MFTSVNEALSLKGKNTIVTGGAKGIGLGITTALAQQGANVAIFARDSIIANEVIHAMESEYSGKFTFYSTDISDIQSCRGSVDQYILDQGSIDVLVNNAGINSGSTGLLSMDDEMTAWFNCYNVNLHGGARMSYLVCKHMRETGRGGSIINITSNAGEIVNSPLLIAYATSKAAFNHFTRCLAAEMAPYKVRVNAIAPGFTNTNFAKDIPEDLYKSICASVPAGRFADPLEIGALAAYLSSDASDIITGAIFTADGGYSLQH